MRLNAILFVSFFFLCSSVWATDKLSQEECRAIVKELEVMSNINPRDIEAKAPDALSRLRNGETLPSYFVAFNIYAENLFNKGKIEKARLEIEEMIGEAFDQTNAECKVIALRTQGQFYYKLGLYERAADCFRNAMALSPRYDSQLLEHCFTWSSTLFWLVQADIRTGRTKEAEHWIVQMDEMMRWLDSTGNADRVGYKQVMILGLKAKIELQRGNRQAADSLLRLCPQYIRADIPSRAYVEYYVAKMQLCVQQDNHSEALPLLEELIEMHIGDYKPIAAEYVYQKGLSLAALGRFEESAQTLVGYVELKEQVNKVALAQQLDELTTRYEVKKLQHERDNMRKRFLIVLTICSAMAIIITLIVVSQKRMRHKNQALARNISELNRLAREANSVTSHTVDTEDELNNSELVDIGKRIVEYINKTECYLHADCSRETIKEGIGVTERTLAKAIVAATGLSFVNYINQMRLNVSIEMLEEKPEMTINDISLACGFGTVRQFQRLFKQHYDLTPSAYREARSSSCDERKI